MKKALYQQISIPEGVEVTLTPESVTITGKEGALSRPLSLPRMTLEKKDNMLVLGGKAITKKEKKIMNTITSHITNMMQGVQQKYEYQLRICSSHFPMTVKVEGTTASIKNFLGEKIERTLKLPQGVDVTVTKDLITIQSTNKELAGQAAANFEMATKIGKRDRRTFQDGIYIISKAGRDI